jgi:hypothetical protein
MALRNRSRRKQRSTRGLMVRCMSEVHCELQGQAAVSFGKTRVSRCADVAILRTNPFVMGVIVGSGSALRSSPKVQNKHGKTEMRGPSRPCLRRDTPACALEECPQIRHLDFQFATQFPCRIWGGQGGAERIFHETI